MEPDRLLLTRRGLLLAGAGTLVLAACGNGSDETATSTTAMSATTAPGASGGGPRLALISSPRLPMDVEVRIPLAVAAADGSIADLDAVPDRITARFGRQDGSLGDPVTIERHDDGIPRHYFPLSATFTDAGVWVVQADIEGETAQVEVQALPSSELPSVPGPGDPLPDIPTPTVADSRGVDPICTREPACPLHSVSLDEALAGDRPVVVIVSTPAFCQQAVCGPVLDLLLEESEPFADAATFIHVEVYDDDTASNTTDAVKELELQWEPSLFLAAPDGTVTERLDYVFDRTELRGALSRLVP